VSYWLLDANVLITAEAANEATSFEAAVQGVAGVVREVHAEVTQSAKSAYAWPQLQVHDLPLGTAAAQVYGLWRGGRTTGNDAGEHASIALAHVHGWGFVTDESTAAFLALRQLPIGHVASLEAWLRSMSARLGQGVVDSMVKARADRNPKALRIF
jgi:hypothetical protein